MSKIIHRIETKWDWTPIICKALFVFMIWSGTWQASASLSSGLLANIYLNKLINGDDE